MNDLQIANQQLKTDIEKEQELERQRVDFFSAASHELKTPLTVILSNAQMLAENVEDPELRKRMTASILTVSQQMKDLVTKLLSSAQVDQGIGAMQFSAVDLSHTVTNALLPFAPIFYEQGMELDSVVQDDIWVQGSQPHLIQVVNILLDNAQKYGVEHGHTRVTLRQQGKKSCLLTVAGQSLVRPRTEKHFQAVLPGRRRPGADGQLRPGSLHSRGDRTGPPGQDLGGEQRWRQYFLDSIANYISKTIKSGSGLNECSPHPLFVSGQ